jgi:hypothetical protein
LLCFVKVIGVFVHFSCHFGIEGRQDAVAENRFGHHSATSPVVACL